jgi:hypothetical protein
MVNPLPDGVPGGYYRGVILAPEGGSAP